MKLKKDSFDFIYELLCDFSVENVDCLTGFETKWLSNIREQLRMLYQLIKERCD